MLNERKLTKAELNKREDIIKDMKKNKRALVKKYGKDAEQVMYGRATNIAKKQTESMNKDKLREMIKDSLQNPKKADLNKDGKLSSYEKKRGAAIEKSMKKQDLEEGFYSSPSDMDESGLNVIPRDQVHANKLDDAIDASGLYAEWNVREGYFFFPEQEENYDVLEQQIQDLLDEYNIQASIEGVFEESVKEDLDLGHQDNEPGMLKGDLYKIGKYAMELYQMMDSLENMGGEIDFPHWWQSKIVKAKSMISSAKHYLDFELKEPQIDAMVGVAAGEDVIDEAVGGKPSQKEVNKFFEETFQETHYLYSKPVEEWDEYDMSNWKAKLRKKKQSKPKFSENFTAKIMKTLKETKSKKK